MPISAAVALILSLAPINGFASQVGNAPQSNHPSIFSQVVAKPTGHNGYEEYAAAADVMREPDVRACMTAVYAPPSGMTPLAARRAWIAAGARALALVRKGNAKPISDPREKLTASTLLPEFTEFKNLARLFVAEAHVRFADGDPAGGTQSLIDSLTFSERIGHFVLIGSLVSIACTAIELREVEAELGVLSQKDALTLVRAADALLQQPANMVDALTSESRTYDSNLEEMFADLPKMIDLYKSGPDDDSETASYQKEAASLSDSQKQALRKGISTAIHSRLDATLAVLRGPEQGWVADQAEEAPAADLRGFLTQAIVPAFGGAMSAAAKVRTQLRLLRLHGAVIAFLWERDRLPVNLDELGDPAIVADPIAGKPFHYQVKGPTAYRLWSDGWGKVGRIELKYSRAGDDAGPAVP